MSLFRPVPIKARDLTAWLLQRKAASFIIELYGSLGGWWQKKSMGTIANISGVILCNLGTDYKMLLSIIFKCSCRQTKTLRESKIIRPVYLCGSYDTIFYYETLCILLACLLWHNQLHLFNMRATCSSGS